MGERGLRSDAERAAARTETLAGLATTRDEIRRLLEPPPRPVAEGGHGVSGAPGAGDAFPRSRTMRMLLSGRGIGTLGAVIGSVFVARPALALRLLRMIPAGTVARMLLIKGIAALRSKGAGHAA